MHYSKTLAVVLSALAMAACGGGSGGDDSGNGGDGGNGGGGGGITALHGYYTLDYAPSGDYRSVHRAEIPHDVDSGEVKLGESTIKFTGANDTLVVEGYDHLIVGEEFSAESGGLMLCKEDEDGDPISWHAILPGHTTDYSGSPEVLLDMLKNTEFQAYADCETHADQTIKFDADGNLVSFNGAGEDAENVAAMLSEEGFVQEEDGYTQTTWMRLHESEGRLISVIFDYDDEFDDVELVVMVQQVGDEE